MIIMAVDPGITKMGIAILKPNHETQSVEVLKRYYIQGPKLCREKKELRKQFSQRFNVLRVYHALFKELILEWGVTDVVSEGAFCFNIVAAFASLTLVIHELENAFEELFNRAINIVAPQYVKKAFFGSGHKDVSKDDMRNRYLTAPFITGDTDKENASEHEIDAVAHGYAWLCRDIWMTVPQAEKKPKKKKPVKITLHP